MRLARRGRHGKRENILGNHGAAADIRVRSDAHELMHGAQSAHYSPLFDRHVTAQSGPIDQHGMIGHRAVVANVGVSHEQNMTAYARDAATFDRAAIDGHELTNFVVLAYLQAGGLPLAGARPSCSGPRAIPSAPLPAATDRPDPRDGGSGHDRCR